MAKGTRKKTGQSVIQRIRQDGTVADIYQRLDKLIATHHPHLAEANVTLVWRFGWARDQEGHIILGKTRKASPLERDLCKINFVILLNHEHCNSAEFTAEDLNALLDHHLCYAQVSTDENDQERTDEDGNTIYRLAKADFQGFFEVAKRHGLRLYELQRILGEVTTETPKAEPECDSHVCPESELR